MTSSVEDLHPGSRPHPTGRALSKSFSTPSEIGTRPEIGLLLCCARAYIDLTNAERIRDSLRERRDWDYLLRVASRHGMKPLLYWNLSKTCPERVPEDTMGQLRNHFHANARRNLVLTAELLKLLQLFDAHGIPAIPFKGPVLAESVYGNLALREFGDLDILVRGQDVLRAKDLLLSADQSFRALSDADEMISLRSGCEYRLVREDGEVAVDLHWRFTTASFPFPLPFEQLQDRLEPVDLAGQRTLSLAPEDLLLVLSMHGSKHLWTRLEWICGVAEVVRAYPQMNWGRVMQQAHELGSKRMLFLGLLLAGSLLGAALPEGIREPVQADSVAKSLAKQVREKLFREVDHPSNAMEPWVFRYRVRERWRDRWPLFMNFVTTLITPRAGDRAFLPLPAALFFLHYLIRPVRLVGEHLLRPLGRSLVGKA